MLMTEDTYQELLEKHLGDDVVADVTDAFDPAGVSFYAESPDPDFNGFTQQPLFETNLLLGEMDDDRKYRLERCDGVLVYTRYEADNGGTFYATGQALACAPGSAEEKAFVHKVVADVLRAAAEPLAVTWKALREADLAPESVLQQLAREELVRY